PNLSRGQFLQRRTRRLHDRRRLAGGLAGVHADAAAPPAREPEGPAGGGPRESRCVRAMAETVFERIERWLRGGGVPFTVLRHEPVFTSEQAAAVRGTSLASRAQALGGQADGRLVLFV